MHGCSTKSQYEIQQRLFSIAFLYGAIIFVLSTYQKLFVVDASLLNYNFESAKTVSHSIYDLRLYAIALPLIA